MKTEKLMDRMSGTSGQQVDQAIAAAREAWERGDRAHVYTARALASVEAEGMNRALNWILSVGWELHSTAIGNSTVGPNMQLAMFVFTRPAPGR